MVDSLQSKERVEDRQLEVLIREARMHRRNRLLVNATKVIVTLVIVAGLAIAATVLLVPSSNGASTPTPGVRPPASPGVLGTTTAMASLPPGIARLSSVACESSQVCVAVGTGGIGNVVQPVAVWTNDGGSTWSRGGVLTILSSLQGVSCAGTTCIAGAGYQRSTGVPLLARSTDTGVRWQIANVRVHGEVLVTACSTPSTCVLSTVKGTYRSTNDGRTWSPLPIRGVGAFDSITCPTATFCIAAGTSPSATAAPVGAFGLIATSFDGGSTWSVRRLSGSLFPRDVQCSSSRACGVVANADARGHLLLTTNGGSSWTTHLLPKALEGISGAACTSSTACIAWGNSPVWNYRPLVTTTDDGGVIWTTPSTPPLDTDVLGMTCPAASDCELVGVNASLGAVILGSTTGYSQWVSQPLPLGVVRIKGAACVSFASCVLATQATQHGAIFRTTDRGAGWMQASLPAGTGVVSSVTCLSATFCAAAANGLLTSTDGGSTWRLAALDLGSQAFEGVACSSSTQCVLVGGLQPTGIPFGARGDSVVYLWRNGRLRHENAPGSVSPLSSVACEGSTCVAVGGFNGAYSTGPVAEQLSVIVSHDGGVNWSRSAFPQGVWGLNTVACATGRSCVAVGQNMGRGGSQPGIVATENAGRTWVIVPTVRGGGLNDVACTTAGVCVASGVELVRGRGGGSSESSYEVRIFDRASHWSSRALVLAGFFNTLGTVHGAGLFGILAAPGATRVTVTRLS